MPREETASTTKTARKAASAKSSAKEGKAKRPPSAYNVFMGENLKKYKEENPGVSHKEAFTAVAAKWADAPENPNRGKSKSDIAAEKKEKAAVKKTVKKKENGAKKSPVASDGDEKDDE